MSSVKDRKLPHPREERTVIIVKPDGVKRGLIGEIITRIEQRGLKVIAIKMIHPTRELVDRHLPKTKEWLTAVGQKSLDDYERYGLDPKEYVGTKDPAKIGALVREWLFDFWTSGPVIPMVIEGIHAIEMVRKIVGHTLPAKAEMGTIRGDFSVDSAILGNLGKRAIHNIVHASGNSDEAENEVAQWFAAAEIHSYHRAEEDIMF